MSSVDDDTLIEVLTESGEPRLTTTEIADELPLARGTVRSRLQALADEGRLDRERDGRDVVWFLPERAGESSPEPDPGPDDAEASDDDTVAAGEDTEPGSDPDDATGDERAVESGGEGGGEADEADDTDEAETEEGDEGTAEPATGAGDGEPAGEESGSGPPDAGSTTAVTERGETVPTGGGPSTRAAPGSPVARADDDTLARAAVAGLLLAIVYYAVRRIRDGS